MVYLSELAMVDAAAKPHLSMSLAILTCLLFGSDRSPKSSRIQFMLLVMVILFWVSGITKTIIKIIKINKLQFIKKIRKIA